MRTLLKLIPILSAVLLSGCAGFDEAYTDAWEFTDAAGDRIDSAMIDRICRKSRTALLDLVDGDEELADLIEARCAERAAS